jgi:hypothetical protein
MNILNLGIAQNWNVVKTFSFLCHIVYVGAIVCNDLCIYANSLDTFFYNWLELLWNSLRKRNVLDKYSQ